MLALNTEIESGTCRRIPEKDFAVVAQKWENYLKKNSDISREIAKGILRNARTGKLTEINVSSSVELAQNSEKKFKST